MIAIIANYGLVSFRKRLAMSLFLGEICQFTHVDAIHNAIANTAISRSVSTATMN